MTDAEGNLTAQAQGRWAPKNAGSIPCWMTRDGQELTRTQGEVAFHLNNLESRLSQALEAARVAEAKAVNAAHCIAFLRSCIRSGESLSAEDDAMVDDYLSDLTPAADAAEGGKG